ncbi:MAG: DegQ family serine endoprotease [Deltaproteobacteria bacterium]|nr:DegQ family serine endoprotease [Deltaproteobacteria bacterium]
MKDEATAAPTAQAAESPATLALDTQTLNQASQSFVDLAKKAMPAVVFINVEKTISGGGMMGFRTPFGQGDPFRDFFERFGVPEGDRIQRGQGSGFVISHDGYIVTNNHVVDGATKIQVELLDEHKFEAELVGTDPKTDIALLKIKEPQNLPALALGDSDELQIGEWVMAIGNPFGLSHTVTAGIVSAKGRVIGAGPYDDFIQTDASINPGNSGGPLINTRGEVIGINTLINASGQGIGFAIPSNMASEIIEQLKTEGSVTRGWLGVLIQPVTEELADALEIEDATGALVSQVMDDSPAQDAGFKRYDLIRKFDGQDVESSNDLPRVVAATPVDKKVDVEVIRDGKPVTLTVKIGKLDDDTTVAGATEPREELGLALRDLPAEMAKTLKVDPGHGALVVKVAHGSAAADAGVREGDAILEVNRKPVTSAADVVTVLKKLDKGQSALLLIGRSDGSFLTTLTR